MIVLEQTFYILRRWNRILMEGTMLTAFTKGRFLSSRFSSEPEMFNEYTSGNFMKAMEDITWPRIVEVNNLQIFIYIYYVWFSL